MYQIISFGDDNDVSIDETILILGGVPTWCVHAFDAAVYGVEVSDVAVNGVAPMDAALFSVVAFDMALIGDVVRDAALYSVRAFDCSCPC
jgi:hypothetical protein